MTSQTYCVVVTMTDGFDYYWNRFTKSNGGGPWSGSLCPSGCYEFEDIEQASRVARAIRGIDVVAVRTSTVRSAWRSAR